MGWLFMHSMGVHTTPRAYLDAQYTLDSEKKRQRILRSAVVRLRTYYAALEIIEPGQPREVIGIVCAIKYNPRDREGYVFGYKNMEETMGPVESERPVAILDLLTPTTHEYAQAWRERCRAYHARRQARPTLRHGDRLIFPEPMRFTNGMEHDRFEVVIVCQKPRRMWLRAPDGGHYRISRLLARNFTLQPPIGAPPVSSAES